MKTKKKRRYTEDFKRDAVKLVEVERLPVAAVARDLGVNVNSLYKWVRDAAQTDVVVDVSDDERAELYRLRKENRVLREEREILKKATAFFARESK
jgi:transposase